MRLESNKYNKIIVGIHNYALRPANNYSISGNSNKPLGFDFRLNSTANFVFGNVYATKNFLNAPTLVAMYQDDEITQNIAADFVEGKLASNGKLPVTIDSSSLVPAIGDQTFHSNWCFTGLAGN